LEQLTPFVSKGVPKLIEDFEDGKRVWKVPPKRKTGEEYLAMWKSEGGHDDVAVPQEEVEAVQRKNMPEVWEEPAAKAK
jgi:large subunit ribosomal protein L41